MSRLHGFPINQSNLGWFLPSGRMFCAHCGHILSYVMYLYEMKESDEL